MRTPRLFALLVFTVITATVLAAQASPWNWQEPARWCNSINRSLGFGWSDGYHAHGSRNSWTAPKTAPTPRHSATWGTLPAWSESTPVIQSHPAAAMEHHVLPVPQAELRRLPPVTR